MEEQQEFVEHLLKDDCYVYSRTLDVEQENGEIVVWGATISYLHSH